MQFKAQIGLGNDAFVQGGAEELARILRELADKVENKHQEFGEAEKHRINDSNGNKVGEYEFKQTSK